MNTRGRNRLLSVLLFLATAFAAMPAAAHPHVWVTTRETLVFDTDGRFVAIRHDWTFDESYSAFATQGLKSGPDGRPSEEELAGLAKVNVESLAESEHFTFGKANGAKLVFTAPSDYALSFDGKVLTLHFVLPLADAVPKLRSLTLSVYDPTFFVDFALAADPGAVELEKAPPGCALRLNRPKTPDPSPAANGSEALFGALSAASGFATLSGRIAVACS